jgi:hypothetical protein
VPPKVCLGFDSAEHVAAAWACVVVKGAFVVMFPEHPSGQQGLSAAGFMVEFLAAIHQSPSLMPYDVHLFLL